MIPLLSHRALLIALRLSDTPLLQHVILSTPPTQVATLAAAIPSSYLTNVLTSLADLMVSSPHLEFVLTWVQQTCIHHGKVRLHCHYTNCKGPDCFDLRARSRIDRRH